MSGETRPRAAGLLSMRGCEQPPNVATKHQGWGVSCQIAAVFDHPAAWSMASWSRVFGCTPTNRSITSPSLISMIVGMLLTW